MLKWVEIAADTFALRIPGGWLVRHKPAFSSDGSTMVLVPDPRASSLLHNSEAAKFDEHFAVKPA